MSQNINVSSYWITNVFTNARLIHWVLQKWRPEVAKKEIGVEIGKKKIGFKDEKSRGT